MDNKLLKTDNIYICLSVIEFYDEYGDVYDCIHLPKIYEKLGNFIDFNCNYYEFFYDVETGVIVPSSNNVVYLNSDTETMHFEDFVNLRALLESFDNICSDYPEVSDVCFKGYSNLVKKLLEEEFVSRDKIYALSKVIFTIHSFVYEFKKLLSDNFDFYETEVIDFNKYKKRKERK